MTREVESDVFYVGVNDRSSDLFEGQWPLPRGISYNSYLIPGEENVLVDTVERGYTGEWLENIEQVVPPSEVDTVIVNHMEPDHSGSLPVLRRLNPDVKIVGNEKTEDLLNKFYGLESGIQVIEDGETLSTPVGEFEFTTAPFVHWPESMVTYESSRGLLFSQDIFGTFGTVEGGLFHGETVLNHTKTEMLRYFSNIIGAFTTPAGRALDQLESLEPELVAPAHGPLWRDDLDRAFELYRRWIEMDGRAGVTVIYGTMYGQTRMMMEAVADGLRETEVEDIEIIDISREHVSFALTEAWRRQGLLFGAPTYGADLFPPANTLLHLLNEKKLKNRTAGFFGSFGWSGGALKKLDSTAGDLDWEQPVEPVKFSGRPEKADLEAGRELGRTVGETVCKQC